jgi:hypothetical protein
MNGYRHVRASSMSISWGFSCPGSSHVKLSRSLASWNCTMIRPKGKAGHIRLPEMKGSSWKSDPLTSIWQHLPSHIKEPARIKLQRLRISPWMSVNIPCIHKHACFGSYEVASNSTIRYGLVRQKKWSCRPETESLFHHSLVEKFNLRYIAFSATRSRPITSSSSSCAFCIAAGCLKSSTIHISCPAA